MYLVCIDNSLAMVYFKDVVVAYIRGPFIMLASKHKTNNIKYVSHKNTSSFSHFFKEVTSAYPRYRRSHQRTFS